jgi:DNA-binding protein H-NS
MTDESYNEIHLEMMDLDDLVTLRQEIDDEINTRQFAGRAAAAAEIRRIAAEAGISLDEVTTLSEKVKGNGSGKGKVEPKYRHPEDPRLTWAGRGRKPAWLETEVQQGRSIDEFRI